MTMRPRGNAAGETREKEKERKIVKWPRIINLHTEQSPQKGREFSLGRDRKGENGGLRRGRPPPRRRTFFKNFLEYFTTTPLSLVVVVVVLLTSVRWSVRLCPPAGDIVGPGVGDWRRLQIYDDSSSSPATLESSRKLLRRERTSLFACLEIIWRVACCRDHRPHRGYPRTDQTRRIIYTRRRGGEGAWPNFPSMTFEGDGASGMDERISFRHVAPNLVLHAYHSSRYDICSYLDEKRTI